MCGIAGIVQYRKEIEQETIVHMSESMKHRGPDDSGEVILPFGRQSVALISRRLSIIDLSAAGQMPMVNRDGYLWIAYNGEIYNHQELRKDLLGQFDILFKSRTDTETLLYAYQCFGLAAFALLDGIFSAAIFDKASQTLILARDRMGVKPLYYFWNEQEFVFASELKTLLHYPSISRRINQQALQLYLCLGYVPSPYTLIDGIHKLTPGHTLTLRDRQLNIRPFWQPVLSIYPDSKDPLGEVQRVRLEVEQAVKAQLMSDVPVGSLLSGGLDSTIISALAQKNLPTPLHTFSVGFITHQSAMEKIYNKDLAFAQQVAQELGTIHHEVIIEDDRNLPSKMDYLVSALDEPLWEPSYLSIYAMSTLASEYGIKVLLTGDGADELFGGYPWYRGALRLEKLEGIPYLDHLLPIVHKLTPASQLGKKALDLREKYRQPGPIQYLINYQHFSPEFRASITEKNPEKDFDSAQVFIQKLLQPVSSAPLADQYAYADILLWVREHFNQRVDRMTMLASIEGRVPFQANNVVDLALSIKLRQKIAGKKQKIHLQRAFTDIVPDFVVRRPKRPFAAPAKAWLFGSLRPSALEYLSARNLNASRILNGRIVQSFVQNYLADPQALTNDRHVFIQVWNLLCLSIWLGQYHVEL